MDIPVDLKEMIVGLIHNNVKTRMNVSEVPLTKWWLGNDPKPSVLDFE